MAMFAKNLKWPVAKLEGFRALELEGDPVLGPGLSGLKPSPVVCLGHPESPLRGYL